MMLRITRLKSIVWKGLVASLLVSCSSTPPTEESKPIPKAPPPRSSVLEEVTELDTKPELMAVTQDPTYAELMQLLTSLGYEGVGLQFESQDRLKLLIQAFSHPKVAYRNLRLLYTGTQWGYDLKHQSLTVGEAKDANQVVAFIEKNIKLKPVSQRKPIVKKPLVAPPAATVTFPKKLPVDVSDKLKKQIPEPAPSPVDTTKAMATPTPLPTPLATETPVPAAEEGVIEPVQSASPTPEAKQPEDETPISPFQKDTDEVPSDAQPESTPDVNQPM